ncbi:hypothetical protein [Marinoscillum sp. 108]|uniref:hypothetical protein n=1 Tax=Marinoscillum sp. 108 TaxID=2653151 RepID=UPI0012F16E30|nr:hypothetical protein [Marinoscillum sp. 108]VXD13660.1 conserved hypothetical protein [Marinoscillum sp. 108]
MSTSGQTYKELALPYFKEVFDIIDKVLVKEDIPYYLIGATAIALEFLNEGKKPPRGTRDIDFALMLSSMAEYDHIVSDLKEYGFNSVEAPWTLYHEKYDVAIDLLPFGKIEENDTESFNKRYSDLHVLGLREVLEDAIEILIEDKVAKIPPLAGMIILKLVAWSDRPEERDNDLTDILKIIELSYEHDWDDIVESHFDLLDQLDETAGQLKISARVLGRKAREYLLKSETLSNRILSLMEEQLSNADSSGIARQWALSKDIDLELAMAILKEFETGLKEDGGLFWIRG